MPKKPFSIVANERGQMFVGYMVALLLISVVMVSVFNFVRSNRRNADSRIYQAQAMDVAHQGFEEAVSYFRRQPSGVYLDQAAAETPKDRANITPWPIYPDAAFLPGPNDTDHWSKLSFAANVVMTGDQKRIFAQAQGARAMIRTYPLTSVTVTTAVGATEAKIPPAWGRYVIRRQNIRNWSPGTNTFSAWDDPEAAHDISHIRYNSPLGSGDYWTLVSHGYVLDNPAKVTYNAYYENTALFAGGNLVSSPVTYYNGKRFLLAQARVYGELYRINFYNPSAAAWVSSGSSITMYSNGILKGIGGYAYAYGTAPSAYGGTASFIGGDLGTSPAALGRAPSVSNTFPGQTAQKLSRLANTVGDINIFPKFDDPNLSDIATRQTFYFVTGAATFLSGTSQRVMTGNGLVFVNGNLTFNQGNLSAWTGIVFVQGNCVVHSPVNITGCLIVTGTLTIGDSPAGNNKAEVTYDSALVDDVKKFLQKFRLDKNSIQATFN
jgi:hypothetical protein